MNEKKFVVIIHVEDENFCLEAMVSWQKVKIPEGFELEILPIDGERKYAAYNFAMANSDAKYKIYVDEKIIIRQENILAELLKIFEQDKSIGMIGCSGAIQLSTHGICINSEKRCGKFRNIQNETDCWEEIDEDCREVEAIDGWFIATQYDIPFREEFGTFADSAQCLEFRRQNYKVVVARQKNSWLWCRFDSWDIEDEDLRYFLNEYSAELFPLVSVIIPTFNRPKYFQEALESALNQTYRNFEIVVSDDSTNNKTEKLIQPYLEKYPCIKYFRNKGFTADDNYNFLRKYNNPDAEYVNWLMDDDLFYPTKIEKMVEVYRNNPNVSLVVSARDHIDKDGYAFENNLHSEDYSKTLSGNDAGKLLLMSDNYIGEPTTVLIRKKFLRDNDLCWSAEHEGFYPLVDVSTWLQLLTQGDLFWINETLSAFREHEGQGTNWDYMGTKTVTCWGQLLKKALDEKFFLENEKEIRQAFLHWFRIFAYKLNLAEEADFHGKEVLELEELNIEMAKAFHTDYKINFP